MNQEEFFQLLTTYGNLKFQEGFVRYKLEQIAFEKLEPVSKVEIQQSPEQPTTDDPPV